MPEKTSSPLWSVRKRIVIVIALIYAMGAAFSAWSVVVHTQASAEAIEQILKRHILQNEASQFLEGFEKEHPVLSTLFASPIKKTLELPPPEESSHALNSEVPRLLRTVRLESSAAAWWSWILVTLSLTYLVAAALLEGGFTTRFVLFSLTIIGLVSFAIGVIAPAMIIWTAPSIPLGGGKLEFVLQHEIRGIGAIIKELLTSGHWVIGGFLLLFSIVTPLTKAGLTLFVTFSKSKELNFKIGEFLHTIGKWSMADVFVAGVLLALFALKSQEATKSIPCMGLYYFIGYCLLSMTTTELLMHSDAVAAGGKRLGKPEKKPGRGLTLGICAALACVIVGSGLYTAALYPLKGKARGAASSLPETLNDAHLGPPGKK